MMNTDSLDREEAAVVLQIARRLRASNRIAAAQAEQEAAAELAVKAILALDDEIDRICTAELDD